MRHSILKGFLVVLLTQHSTSEGMSGPIQFPTEAVYQDGQTFLQEPEIVTLVSTPSLRDVQQAMQKASEQVKGRGAEEVLKELLERVVEAALGQVEAAVQAKDMAVEKESVEEDAQGESEAEEESETLEPLQEGANMTLEIGDNGFEKSEVEARVDTFINVAGGGKEVVKEEGGKVAGSVEETTDRAAVSLEVTGESLLETILTREAVDGAVEETEGDLEAAKKDSKEQVVLMVLKNASERETQDGEETPATVEVAVGVQPEQEKEEESKAGLGVADEEQIENSRRKEAALLEISHTDHTDGGKALLHPNDHVIQIKPVFGEPIKEERAARREENMDGLEKPDNGLVEIEKAEADGTDLRAVIVEAKYGEVVIKEGSVALVVEGGDNAGEEEQIALEDSEDSKEDQAAMVIPGPQSEENKEDFTEKRPGNQLSTPNPSFGAGTTEDNTLIEVKSNHQGRTITSKPGFLPHNHGRIQPTLDKFENNVFAEYHQEEGEKPNGIRDAVEVTPGKTDKNEQGLEAWKTGAIFTAVFLVLETVVIIIYVLKCRNKKSTPAAMQEACEEACVEPETEMGGDCSDDTLTEDNENSQEITRLDSSDVASALSIEREKQRYGDVVAMSNCSPSSTEMMPSPGPGSDSLQDIRTPI